MRTTRYTFVLFMLWAACSDEGDPAADYAVVASFDPATGQLPEGLAVRGQDAFVSFAFSGQVHSVPTAGGDPELYASVPGLPAENSFVTGLSFDARGQLYIAHPSFVAEPAAGVYRAPNGGGEAVLFASHSQMVFPSDVEEHPSGDLFVTDSATATIFRVMPDGEASVWITDERLAGGRELCQREAAFDVGANGLAVTESALYVAVTDRATVFEIPIDLDGSPGALRTVAGPDCALLGGADGLIKDGDSLWVAVNYQNRIVRVDLDGSIDVVLEGDLLDFPSAVRVTDIGGRRALLINNFALGSEPGAPSLARLWIP